MKNKPVILSKVESMELSLPFLQMFYDPANMNGDRSATTIFDTNRKSFIIIDDMDTSTILIVCDVQINTENEINVRRVLIEEGLIKSAVRVKHHNKIHYSAEVTLKQYNRIHSNPSMMHNGINIYNVGK